MIKAIVIEDEVNVRKALIKAIEAFCEGVDVVGFAGSVKEGIALVDKMDFDLLFLDVNLSDGTGFDLLKEVKNKKFDLIFVTAHDKYALRAFKLSAVDYLLKPISPAMLKAAVSKVRRIKEIPMADQLSVAQSHIDVNNSQEKKIILSDADSLYLKKIKDILYCKAEGSYTVFTFVGGSTIMTSHNLKEYEGMLIPFKFIRCHHSYLCNLYHVSEIKKTDGGSLIMSDMSVLPISHRKKSAILDKMKTLFIN